MGHYFLHIQYFRNKGECAMLKMKIKAIFSNFIHTFMDFKQRTGVQGRDPDSGIQKRSNVFAAFNFLLI